MDAVFGLRCRQHLAGNKRLPIALAAASPFNLPYFHSSAPAAQLPYLPHSIPGQNENTDGAMKLLPSALLALLFVPAELAVGQESHWDQVKKLSTGTKMEVVDAQYSAIQGQLVSIDDQSLAIRRKGQGSAMSETIARADVVRVTVKRPSAKKIALFALGGSALGALGGGSRCKGPTDYTYTPYGGYSTCRNSNGYYFDGKGGAIGAGAALGLLGFAFPEKKILYQRSILTKVDDAPSPTSGADSSFISSQSSPQSQPGSAHDKARESKELVPAKTNCETRVAEKGDCHAPQQ
jgi:hypothetical protein